MNINLSTNSFISNKNVTNNKQLNITNHTQKNNIKFKGIQPNELSKILDTNIDKVLKTNPLDIGARIKFHKVINELLPEIMTPENFINKGRESKVYKISDKYVAKVKRGYDANSAIHFYNFTKLPDKRFNQLDIYYGEPVIKLGNTEILKNATPTKNFICCGTSYRGAKAATIEERDQYDKNFVPLCASIPQESYDKFAIGLAQLNQIHDTKLNLSKVYYTPDIINPNNILISNKEFKIVDKLDQTKQKEPNTLFTMLEPLLIRLSPESYAHFNEKLVEPRSTIYKKCLIAATKANLPIENSLTYEYSDYYLGDILKNRKSVSHEYLRKMRLRDEPLENRLDYIENAMK